MKFIRIKITSTPRGKAPEEIREKWIGLELDGVAYESGILIGPGPDSLSGFITFIDRALHTLKAHNQEAFKWWSSWWKDHPSSEVFLFDSGCYRVIDSKKARERENQAFLDAFKGKALEELVDYIMKD